MEEFCKNPGNGLSNPVDGQLVSFKSIRLIFVTSLYFSNSFLLSFFRCSKKFACLSFFSYRLREIFSIVAHFSNKLDKFIKECLGSSIWKAGTSDLIKLNIGPRTASKSTAKACPPGVQEFSPSCPPDV